MTETEKTIIRTSAIGDVPKFQIGDDFEVYKEILEQFFIANRVEANLQVPIVLSSSLSVKVYEVLRELTFPDKPHQLSLVQLTTILGEQFSKQESVLRKRIEFFDLKQIHGENVNNWFVRVKSSAMYCKFGAALLEENVKNIFLAGLRKGPILDRMCEEDISKPLNDLVKVAVMKEAAMLERGSVDVNKLQPQRTTNSKSKGESNHKFQKGGQKENNVKENKVKNGKEAICNACGKTNHNFSFCKYKKYKCSVCQEKGHLATVCPKNVKSNHKIEVQEVDFYYSGVDKSIEEPIFLDVCFDGVLVRSELDTGAGKKKENF